MKSLFFLLITVIFTFSCSKKHPESYNYDRQNPTLKDKILVKIEEIKPEIKFTINREKAVEFGISMSRLQDAIRLADINHKMRTVKAAEQLVIEDANGKKHRLSEFAEIHMGITVRYAEPWDSNPFNN